MNKDEALGAVVDSVKNTSTRPVRWGQVEQDSDLTEALGAVLETDSDVRAALQSMVTLAIDAVDGAVSCGVTAMVGGRTFTVVHSDARTLLIDIEQYEAGDGPCLHAARSGELVRVDARTAAARWPAFADAARRENIRSFLAAPWSSADSNFGSLNLYGEQDAAFTDADADTVTALTRTLARSLGIYQRFDQLLDQYNGVRTALDHRAPIEQAKGMLMAIHGIDADAAFVMLAEHSQQVNRKVRDLAAELVDHVVNAPRDTDPAAAPVRHSLLQVPSPS